MFVLLFLLITAADAGGGATLYHTADELLGWYRAAAAQEHRLLRFEHIGEGGEQDAVPLATITQPEAAGAAESASFRARPVATLVFGEHSREIITSEVSLWLSRLLLGDAGELLKWPELEQALADGGMVQGSPRETVETWRRYILEHLAVQIIPIENMDGRRLWEAGELCRRKSGAGVDLNRNWPFAWRNETAGSEQYGGTAPFSEPQSRALRDLVIKHRPKAFINSHSGEWAIYVPWDSKEAYTSGMAEDMQEMLDRSAAVCQCQAGPAGAVSQYLAYGTSMDYMHTVLNVPYPLTLEFYGSGREGLMLTGQKNKPLSSFKLVERPAIAAPSARRLRALLAELRHGRALAGSGAIRSLVQRGSREGQSCFAMYNPVKQSEYRNVVSRWVVALMVILRHVADPAHPRIAAAPAAAAAHRRQLLTSRAIVAGGAAAATGGTDDGGTSHDALLAVQHLTAGRKAGGGSGGGAAAQATARIQGALGGSVAAVLSDSAEAVTSAHGDSVVASMQTDAASSRLKAILTSVPAKQFFDDVPVARGAAATAAGDVAPLSQAALLAHAAAAAGRKVVVDAEALQRQGQPLTYGSVVSGAALGGDDSGGGGGGLAMQPAAAVIAAAGATPVVTERTAMVADSDDEGATSLKTAAAVKAFQAVLSSGKGGEGTAFLKAVPTAAVADIGRRGGAGTVAGASGSSPSTTGGATRFTTDTSLSRPALKHVRGTSGDVVVVGDAAGRAKDLPGGGGARHWHRPVGRLSFALDVVAVAGVVALAGYMVKRASWGRRLPSGALPALRQRMYAR